MKGCSDLKSAAIVQFDELKGGNELSCCPGPIPQGEELQFRALVWVLSQLYSRGSQRPPQEHCRALHGAGRQKSLRSQGRWGTPRQGREVGPGHTHKLVVVKDIDNHQRRFFLQVFPPPIHNQLIKYQELVPQGTQCLLQDLGGRIDKGLLSEDSQCIGPPC